MMSSATAPPNYNEILLQISTNLDNTLRTFGPSSPQYKTVLQMLKDCLREIETTVTTQSTASDKLAPAPPDPDMLSLAMRFLKLEE
ncbi:hypothetical protein VTN77DRAFT_300 [Rasamsonia byssochlamydoides]|uniref:uncharacterized protein n=1 Tax=Rasamsonia byssochlamydoides TaxID=89139 RepID=UPI00374344EA